MTTMEVSLPAGVLHPDPLDVLWTQVLERDPSADGKFFYAVRSTGIFCRPVCPSRRPVRRNVVFFASFAEAESAGFRACLRCRPKEQTYEEHPTLAQSSRMVAAATSYLGDHATGSVSLKRVANEVGSDPVRMARSFRQVLGVTPGEFARARRLDSFKDRLRQPTTSVTEAMYDAGFGSSSRLYESASEKLGMTPRQWKAGGRGESIRFGIGESTLGFVLVAATDKGICSIGLGDTEEELERELRERFHHSELARVDESMEKWLKDVIGSLRENPAALSLPLDVRATAFQLRVWQELQAIPRGETRSYAQVAKAIGAPRAVRAVARACASNPVALAIPCHRVIGQDGRLTGYRWGLERKRALLAAERENG